MVIKIYGVGNSFLIKDNEILRINNKLEKSSMDELSFWIF